MKLLVAIVSLLVPGILLAQSGAPSDFKGLVNILLNIISVLIVLVFALTFIVLAWSVVKAWIINADSEIEVEKGKRVALVGVIALVIMSGIWGILALLRTSLFGV